MFMSFLGKTIRLKGKTQKGRNRVREHGEMWSVFAETDKVLFSVSRKGPWLFISPEGKTQDHKASRWIHGADDEDFDLFISG
jgi:hypothetical protein